MSRRKITESEALPPEALDVKEWAIVLIDNLNENDKEVFLKRKKAIDMYMNNQPIKLIRTETGIDFESLRRLVRRCITMNDENGVMLGYRGLIPNKRIRGYTRISQKNSNYSGMFTQLLKTHSSLKDIIEKYYFQNNKRLITDPKMKAKHIHKKFLEECRRIGISEASYPFNTETLAKRSLERYLKKLDNKSFVQAAGRYGESAARIASSTGSGSEHHISIVRPLERVQFDGHCIDGIFSITFRTPEGDEITRELERIWLLVILDVASRAVIGYHLSTSIEYSAVDVMQCIRNAVVPKEKKKLTIPGLHHKERGGFPSECIPEMKWGLWDELLYDNGKANLSKLVTDRLVNVIGSSTNAGPVALPVRRGYIERFFGVLAENGYHRMINTTGSHPRDPRRDNPKEKAIKYAISFEHLEELTDVLISDYNGTVNEGINNLTPLEVLRQRINRGLLPRVMPEEQRGETIFLSMKIQRKINGSVKDGRRPFIHFEGVDYRNDVLSRSPGLIGTKLDLLVNVDDLRVINTFLPDGSEFGALTGTGKWGITPHSLEMRRQINALRKRGLIHFTSEDDPIDCFHRYLETQSVSKRSSRNRLAEQQRRIRKHTETIGESNLGEVNVPVLKPDSSNIKDSQRVNRITKNFKTITF
ncbi:hypothetical protein LQV63_10240 [Paenibacillus profundus]|uniref:Integrase catalytic domain-containing protein n=1 Tax=Paenibacillus profundus TaxID=1173085 RepID=A0ABS8YF51_9BACL|nr:hypothetical protein [Paenibacillus profundus]MCE5169692.1 hypothetical protein [Paenibacillus profundus]